MSFGGFFCFLMHKLNIDIKYSSNHSFSIWEARSEDMAGYRRLISYIYAYEGEEKGKNIGFAKLESRNGQCRLSVNVKKVYAGGNDIGVYLLSSGQEIFLGNIFIRNGCGEFRTIINVENVMGTGNSMDSCIGLIIHEKGEEWRVYKTVWEDAVAQAAELDLAEAAEKKQEDIEKKDERLKKQIEELNREIDEAAKSEVVQEKVEASEAMPEQSAETANSNITVERDNIVENAGAVETEAAAEDAAPEVSDISQNTPEPEILQQSQPSVEQPPTEQAPAGNLSTEQPQQSSRPSSHPLIQTPQQEEIPLGNPKDLERLDAEEEKWGPEVLWNRFRKHYPKMQAFDSPGTAEILTICPQDIGLLPRENWGYGNNSFLLHGYYNYRYLIFARVGDEKHTRARYILGVPGHYYSNEKYMASMFGFPHFVLAKTQPAQDGRFGYWYADVRMENVE